MTSTHGAPTARHDSVTVRLGSDQDGYPYTLACECGAVAPVLAVTDDVVPTWWAIHRAAHDAPPGRLVADLHVAREAALVAEWCYPDEPCKGCELPQLHPRVAKAPQGWERARRAAGMLPPNRSEWIDPDTWRDLDCIECGGEGAPCCEPPDTPPPRWVHCSPELLAAGIDCTTTPRRPCRCPHCGSHDHSVSR